MPARPDDTPAQIEAQVSSLLDAGQIFFARDAAADGLALHPDSLRLRVLFALALIRSGAVAEAVATLRPVLARVDTRPLVAAHVALQHAISQAQRETTVVGRVHHDDEAEPRREPLPETLTAIAELVTSFEAVRSGGLRARRIEPALLLELGELHIEAWQRTSDRDLLETARALLEEAFGVAGDPRAGALAAAVLRLLGEQRESHNLAREVLAGDDRAMVGDRELVFRRLGARGLAALLAEQPDRALKLFSDATEALGRRSTLVVPLLRLTRKLRSTGVTVPLGTDSILRPPGVVVFTGHMIDPPEAATERFPAWLEVALRAEIATRLERMDVQIGYSGASCGSEMLFVESLLDRDGEVNLVLPFDTEDYIRTCVTPGGGRWERRFRNALRLAHSVAFATHESYMGHDELFRFQNQMLQGLSTLRAQFLEIAPNLLAVWDMTEDSLTGGAAEFIDQWTDIARLQIIDIDDVRETARATTPPLVSSPMNAPRPASPLVRLQPERTVRTMLFSDFVGYSKLTEQCMPHYLAFLDNIALDLRDALRPAETVETWGDAIFAVMPRATDLVRFAFALNEAIKRHRSADPTRGVWLDTRISLHAGPVFPGKDPFTGRPRFTGTHINRAARLEPVTVPGQIYATQHFVALLAAEESQRQHEVDAAGEAYNPIASCSYLGILSLAKGFGKDAVYHVEPL